MSKCKLSVKRFKEFLYIDKDKIEHDCIDNSGNPINNYYHTDENEIFLVGYKYKEATACPEIKMKLSDIMDQDGGGGDGGGGGGSAFNPGYVNVSFSLNPGSDGGLVGYGTWDEDEDGQMNLTLSMPKIVQDVEIYYDAEEEATGKFDFANKKLELHLLPGEGGGGGGGSIEISDVQVKYDAEGEAGGEWNPASGELTIHLKPMPTFDLYKVVIRDTTNRAQIGDIFQLAGSQTWSKYNKANGRYEEVHIPTFGSNDIVEVTPTDSSPAMTALNLRYGTFGNFASSSVKFYTIEDTLTDHPQLEFLVKHYKNL